MQKFLKGISEFAVASELLATVYLTSAILGEAVSSMADVVLGLFLLVAIVASIVKLTYEAWNRLRFECALRTVMKTKAATVTAMKPYAKPWSFAPCAAASILICTVLHVFNPPARIFTVLCGAAAGAFAALALIIMSIAYAYLWCWRKLSKQDRQIEKFNLIFPRWNGEEAKPLEMGPGWPKEFSFKTKDQLPYWWCGL